MLGLARQHCPWFLPILTLHVDYLLIITKTVFTFEAYYELPTFGHSDLDLDPNDTNIVPKKVQIYKAFRKLLFRNLFSVFSDGDLAPNHCCGLWRKIM